MRVKSIYPFAETVERLKKDIATKGIRFFSEIDQASLAADAGVKIEPSTLLVFGNPPLGTQFIAANQEQAKIAGRELRFRKLTIEPGGIVPRHSHDDRPALIYVAEGEIHEYASNCAAPIVHKTGEIRAETHGTAHWWKNLGDKTVVLFVGDVRRDPNDHNM